MLKAVPLLQGNGWTQHFVLKIMCLSSALPLSFYITQLLIKHLHQSQVIGVNFMKHHKLLFSFLINIYNFHGNDINSSNSSQNVIFNNIQTS